MGRRATAKRPTGADGTAVADLRLAVTERYTARDGNQAENTLFIDVVVWRRQAETASEYLSKGRPVLVEGRLQMDEWENQQGEKRTRIRVVAQRVQFLGSPRGETRGEPRGEAAGVRPAAQPTGADRPPAAPSPPPEDVPGPEDVGEDDIPF
jgi:single-strand DNA-binding protein